MNVGLYNLERQIVNTAMMRVSQWHKEQGDSVEVYDAWKGYRKYDKIYVFSIFDFTPKKNIPPNAICGGTGFNIFSTLPPEIEASDYDWSIYPKCDFSLIWFSTGCCYPKDRHPYCVVVDKEGCIKSVKPKNLNPNGKYIKVMDNNFFANPEWKSAIRQLHKWRQPCDFQGLDIRLMNREQCEYLKMFKSSHVQFKVAWDDPREDMLKYFKRAIKFIKPYRFMSYILIGFWSSEREDIMRVEELRKLGIDSFVMPYDKEDAYQSGFARYVNHKAEYKSQTWDEYKSRKNVPNGPRNA